MITGFGRTGRWFGVNHDGVVPDIMTVGKGMAERLPDQRPSSPPTRSSNAEPFARSSASSSSYGGNPLASTAAPGDARDHRRRDLVEHSARVGAHDARRACRPCRRSIRFIGDVRGNGLMLGIDLVNDRKTNELVSTDFTKAIFLECLRRGLLVMGYSPASASTRP